MRPRSNLPLRTAASKLKSDKSEAEFQVGVDGTADLAKSGSEIVVKRYGCQSELGHIAFDAGVLVGLFDKSGADPTAALSALFAQQAGMLSRFHDRINLLLQVNLPTFAQRTRFARSVAPGCSPVPLCFPMTGLVSDKSRFRLTQSGSSSISSQSYVAVVWLCDPHHTQSHWPSFRTRRSGL